MKILLMVCWEKNGFSALTQMPVENGCIAAASLQMRMGSIFALFAKLPFLDFYKINDMQGVYFIHIAIIYLFQLSLLCRFTFISNSV